MEGIIYLLRYAKRTWSSERMTGSVDVIVALVYWKLGSDYEVVNVRNPSGRGKEIRCKANCRCERTYKPQASFRPHSTT
jgi:hypothetical protein